MTPVPCRTTQFYNQWKVDKGKAVPDDEELVGRETQLNIKKITVHNIDAVKANNTFVMFLSVEQLFF